MFSLKYETRSSNEYEGIKTRVGEERFEEAKEDMTFLKNRKMTCLENTLEEGPFICLYPY